MGIQEEGGDSKDGTIIAFGRKDKKETNKRMVRNTVPYEGLTLTTHARSEEL